MPLRPLIALVFLVAAFTPHFARAADDAPPAVAREFRAAWIATVANIDWPSKPGLPAAEQRAELGRLLDVAQGLKMNAVVLQVRPACDALYKSKLEPWSDFLTGEQGRAPDDGYDPLAWACAAAHERGLELHAWFNPYRAWHPGSKGEAAPTHVSRTLAAATKTYGPYQWLDPGDERASAHSLAVIADVVRRYDVDGVHFDDYFYPYPVTEKGPVTEEGEEGAEREVPFPDEASWRAYCAATPGGERMTRDDWRRDNVDRFVRAVGQQTHALKAHVKYGVSPFGIWRPGTPPSIAGFDPYAKLYADSRRWLREGWVDYFTPQLYWPIAQTPQSFTTLLGWWREENPHGRRLWPGLYTSKVGSDPKYSAEEIADQVAATRGEPDGGHVHFSFKAVAENYGAKEGEGVADRLRELYAEPALVPSCVWLAGAAPAPGAPTVSVAAGEVRAVAAGAAVPLATWVVQRRCATGWETELVPYSGDLRDAVGAGIGRVAVSVVDRFGRQGTAAVVAVP